MDAKTLLASLAKSKSRTSAGGTGTIAKASLSSFTADVPIWNEELLLQHVISHICTLIIDIRINKRTHPQHNRFFFFFVDRVVGAVDPCVGAQVS